MEGTEQLGEFVIQDLPRSEQVQSQPLISTSARAKFELLILSEAGKPIYSFSKRSDAVTLMPLCSALIDYAQRTQKETLNAIKTADNLIINFSKRPPLIIIVIHDVNSYVDPHILFDQVEAQIISILTAKTLRSVFEERPTYDLKKPLYGSEKLIDSIINLTAFTKKLSWPWTESFLTFSSMVGNSTTTPLINLSVPQRPNRALIPIAVMPPNTRDNLHSIIENAVSSNSKNMVFSLLFRVGSNNEQSAGPEDDGSGEEGRSSNDGWAGNQAISDTNNYRLVTICNHHDRHGLKVADVHIILALLCGSKVQIQSAESLWMPICLPRFNHDAFLHSYISYINESSHCLVMMSIDREEFTNCQLSRNVIEEKLGNLLKDRTQRNKIYYQMSPLVHPVLLELQNKLMSVSLTDNERAEAEQQAQIYNSKTELYHARQLQFLWYQTNKQVLWWQRSDQYPPNSIIYYMTKKMIQSSLKHLWLKLDEAVFLGWYVPSFQLYAQFDSSITTNEASEVVQRITNWIKKEEDNFTLKDFR